MLLNLKSLTIILVAGILFGCDTNNGAKQLTKDTAQAVKNDTPQYKAIKFTDDFLKTNNEAIKQNEIQKEKYEALFTKQILPLIDKNGLYDDLPFELSATMENDGVAYGNFIYEDDRYFVKVECILKKKQAELLKENNKYTIKFKVAKFTDAASFEGETGKIELPVADAYLVSFVPYKK